METTRIVLTAPFMRHPAGLVFDLPETTPIGWDDDVRVRERQNYSGRRAYRLPDTGRGVESQLPASDTAPCPPGVFDHVDIRTGPCRITAVASGMGAGLTPTGLKPEWQLPESNVYLLETDGQRAQGIGIRFPEGIPLPRHTELINLLGENTERTFSDTGEAVAFDLSGLSPGFYRLLIECQKGVYHSIRFMKSYPLLVMFTGGGRYTTRETMY